MTCLWEDYDICLGYNKMLHFLATEICSNPEYTKYMNLPLSQEDVNYNLLALNKKTEYSRLVAELYIAAISNALDLHIRVIQNIAGYYGVLNTCPLPNMGSPENKKTITLILIDDTYHPVVNVPGQPPAVYKSIQQVSTEKCPVVLVGETPGKQQTASLFVPETQIIPETQLVSKQNTPGPEIIPESPQSSQEVVFQNYEISPQKRKRNMGSNNISHKRSNKSSKKNAKECIVISSESESEENYPTSPVFSTEVNTPGTSQQFPPTNPEEATFYTNLRRQITRIEEGLKQEPDCEDDIPYCPEVRNVGKRIRFNMKPFQGMVPDVVSTIPHDIDGTKFYIIDVPQEDPFHTKYRDGRYFLMHSSSRKGFRGVRRVGKCRGSFQCNNDNCPLYLESSKRNQHQFTTIARDKFCYSCNCLVDRIPCGALKLIEFNMQNRLLEVYHFGNHTCKVKPDIHANDQEIEHNIRKYGATVGPKKLAQIRMTEELKKQMDTGEFDMDEIVGIAAKMSDKKRIHNIRQKLHHELKSEKHSMSAFAELKVSTDTADNFLIYKIYDNNMTGTGISYIFKSLRRMAKLMLSMDQDNQLDNPLKHEPCYFDGMHKRCQNWKTLTLWVYHPSSRKLMRLATCEVKGETSQSCALFWKCLNSMLQDVTNNPETKFNPAYFICDEAGANFNGIQEVFGDQGVRKTKSCQFHFKQSLQRILLKFPPEVGDLRNEFEELMTTLLTVTTLREYRDLKIRIQQISAVLPSIGPATEWWFARRYNLFPIFRGYCISSVNLAEIGHSTLKRAKPIALVDAAWEDTCTMILQEQEHTAFLAGRNYSSGKGPTTVALAEKQKRQQLKRSRNYQRAFAEQNFDLGDKDSFFIPAKRARHRHPEVSSFGICHAIKQ